MAVVLSRKSGGGSGGGAPSGPAGGDLSGTYPNPDIGNGVVDTAQLVADSVDSTIIDGADSAAIRALLGVLPGATLFDSTLGADATTIDTGANGVAQTHAHLLIFAVCRTTQAAVGSQVNITFNADTGANYNNQRINNNNVSLTQGLSLTGTSIGMPVPGANAVANAAGACLFFVPGYRGTVFHKGTFEISSVPDDTAADRATRISTSSWLNTAAITRVTFTAASNDILTGSRLSIYGIG